MGGGGTGGGLLEWQRQLFDHLTCLIEYECVGMYPKELRLLQQGGWPPYALLSSEPTEDHEDLDYVKEVLEAVKVEARDGMNGGGEGLASFGRKQNCETAVCEPSKAYQ